MMNFQRTVFIVDGSEEERVVYRHFLERDTRYINKFIEFNSAFEAIVSCQKNMPDLILVDFILPDADGLEFLEQLKSVVNHNYLPVLILSGQGDETTAVQVMKSGAADYLVKGRLTSDALNRSSHTVMERIHLMRKLDQQQEQQRLIATIALRIRQFLHLDNVLKTAVEEIRNFLKTDRVFVYKLDPNMTGRVVAESVDYSYKSLLNKIIEDGYFNEAYGKYYPEESSIAIDDIYKANLSECHQQMLEYFEVRATIIVPIIFYSHPHQVDNGNSLFTKSQTSENPLWGLLIADSCRVPRKWQKSEIELLEQLSVQLAIAIQQAELYQNLQIFNAQLEAKVEERTLELKQSIDERTKAEFALVQLNQGLELRVKERTEQIRCSLEEKETLLKEIHHRVKNNLQIISSLLRMQCRRGLDEGTLVLFQESQNRLQSMALIHEQLYQSPDLSQIDFGEYVRKLTDNLFRSYGVSQKTIGIKIETNNIKLALDIAIPCGLLINELVSNSLKYAFPDDNKGKINILLKSINETNIILTVSDTGIGIPDTLNWQNSNSLGLRIVHNLTRQLKGNIILKRNYGTTFDINFSPTSS